jgi:(S)-mandelate dehydrogenase
MSLDWDNISRQSYEKLRGRFPAVALLRDQARRNAPSFAFEYADGGAGSGVGISRNRSALDAIELLPRYGTMNASPSTSVELFGRRYAVPIGVAPVGSPSIVFPGAELLLAKAAQKARIPYTLGLIAGATIEEIAELAPDVFWFQLYRCGNNDHCIAIDVMQRAQAAGVHVLMLTLDVPVRNVRPRELTAGLGRSSKFRPSARMMWEIMTHPRWAHALLVQGQPRFASLQRYAGMEAGLNDTIEFAKREVGGTFSWDEIARYRDQWRGPLVAKGILSPSDAEKAVAIGFDGIVVSNHGGRQNEALPAAIDCLPAIVRAVGKKATVLIDSGIESGTDVVRSLALGAAAAFSGKAFLWALGALGARGPDHVLSLFQEETQAALAQIGARDVADAKSTIVRHSKAFQLGR